MTESLPICNNKPSMKNDLNKEEFLSLMKEYNVTPKSVSRFALDLRECNVFVNTFTARLWARVDITQPKYIQAQFRR